ncbi:glycosyltransferase family 4 protein [Halorubrum ruber]|nr:glycosyltransferase family 4 protein [Halorubrum ruber]
MDVLLFGKNHGQHGPTRVTRGIGSALQKMGHSVRLITYGDRSDSPHPDIEIDSHPLPEQSILSWWNLYKNVKNEVCSSEYDVFHALERYPFRSDVRTVQWTSDSYIVWRRSPESSLHARSLAGDIILNWMSRRGAKMAKSIIASSPETEDQMRSLWHLPPEKIVPLGIESAFRSPPSPVKNKVEILFVGRFEQRKGYDRILPHLNPDNPEYNINIVGGVKSETYAESLLGQKWENHYLGYLNDRELERKYQSTDIVIIPSYLENFSMVALEAIAKGCIVIITRDCGFAQFKWANPDNGIYVADSGSEIVEWINKILKNRNDIQNKKASAFKLSERLTWDNVAKEYTKVYESLTSGDES